MKKITILAAILSALTVACNGGGEGGSGNWDMKGVPNVRITMKDEPVSSVNKSITFVDGELKADAMLFSYIDVMGIDDRYPEYVWRPTLATSIGDVLTPGQVIFAPAGLDRYSNIYKEGNSADLIPVSGVEGGVVHLDTVDIVTTMPVPINGWNEETHTQTTADKPEFYGVGASTHNDTFGGIGSILKYAVSSLLENGTNGAIIGARPTADQWWFEQFDTSLYASSSGANYELRSEFYDKFTWAADSWLIHDPAEIRGWRMTFSDIDGDVADFGNSATKGYAARVDLKLSYRKDFDRVITAWWGDTDGVFQSIANGKLVIHVKNVGRVTWNDLSDIERSSLMRLLNVTSVDDTVEATPVIVRLMNMSALVADGRTFAVIGRSDAEVDQAAYYPIVPNTTVDIRMRVPAFGGREVTYTTPDAVEHKAVVMKYGVGSNGVPLDVSVDFIPQVVEE